jgi:hypothetical protein
MAVLVNGLCFYTLQRTLPILIKVARGQAPLSSLLVFWGEGHIYRFCSKWLKSSSKAVSRKVSVPTEPRARRIWFVFNIEGLTVR